MPGTILFLENNPAFQDIYAELLETAGYTVLKASTLQQARRFLLTANVHLALVDVRLADDDDPEDESGMQLVLDPDYAVLPKIVLTSYPSTLTMGPALRMADNGLPPAFDYLDKAGGPDALFKTVADAFTKRIRINWKLRIRWQDSGDSFAQRAAGVAGAPRTVSLDVYADALEDLFRKLFSDCSQISIGRVLAKGNGYAMLEVLAHAESGARDAHYVVAYGTRRELAEQVRRHGSFAPTESVAGAVLLKRTEETIHFAAALYELSDAEFGKIVLFQTYYFRYPPSTVACALTNFYAGAVRRWHSQPRTMIDGSQLATACFDWLGVQRAQWPGERLESQIAAICGEATACNLLRIDNGQHLQFYLLPDQVETYASPATTLHAAMIHDSSHEGVIHGRVNASTVLLAPDGLSWLIDASHAGEGPLLIDYVRMEADIALHLMDELDPAQWHDVQCRLLDAARLDAEIDASALPPAAEKAIAAIQAIRHAAATDVGIQIEPYLLGLHCCYLAEVMGFDASLHYAAHDMIPVTRSLLAAAMLGPKLSATQPNAGSPAAAAETLWLDFANRTAWVEGRQVSLTPQEFKILSYLYSHRGKLCTREQIVREALGEAGTDTSTEYQRLNSAISRLREKLGDDPDHPRYLHALRGHGYRLQA